MLWVGGVHDTAQLLACVNHNPHNCAWRGIERGRECLRFIYVTRNCYPGKKQTLKCLLAWQIKGQITSTCQGCTLWKMITVSCPGEKYRRDCVFGLTRGQMSNNVWEAKVSRLPEATTVLAHKVFSMLRLSLTGGSPSSWKRWQNKYTDRCVEKITNCRHKGQYMFLHCKDCQDENAMCSYCRCLQIID